MQWWLRIYKSDEVRSPAAHLLTPNHIIVNGANLARSLTLVVRFLGRSQLVTSALPQ